MFNWIRKLLDVVKYHDTNRAKYQSDISSLQSKIETLEERLRDHTTIGMDIDDVAGRSMVVVLGKYANNDYVRTYTISAPSFTHIIDELNMLDEIGKVKFVDVAPAFKAVIERNRKGYYDGIEI